MKHKIIDIKERLELFRDYLKESVFHDEADINRLSLIITDLTKQGEPEDNPVGKMVGMSKNCDNTFVSIQIFDSYKSIDFQRGDYFYIRPQASYEMEEILKELSRLTASQSPQGVEISEEEWEEFFDDIQAMDIENRYMKPDIIQMLKDFYSKHLSPAPNTELLRDCRDAMRKTTTDFIYNPEKWVDGSEARYHKQELLSLVDRIDNELGGK